MCTSCSLSHFVHDEGRTTSKRLSRKVLWYLQIIPSYNDYLSWKMIKYMSWHKFNPSPLSSMTHLSHGQAWRHFYDAFLYFDSDPQNVRLGLYADGFSPFGFSANLYSICLVILTMYNLPSWLSIARLFLFLTLQIPCPNSPSQNVDIYLCSIVDNLKLLWEGGVQTWDMMLRQNFQMFAALLRTIGDFSAYNMLSRRSTHGKLAYPYLMSRTKSFQLKYSRKATCFICNRQYLLFSHQFRQKSYQFVTGWVKKDGPPLVMTGAEITAEVDRLPSIDYSLFLKSKEKLSVFGESHN